jgi:hypothetical protein
MTNDDERRHDEAATAERTGGAWIGQHPDENTEDVRGGLDAGAERVAVTSNESDASPSDEGWPHGHREGAQAGDDDIRQAGEDR